MPWTPVASSLTMNSEWFSPTVSNCQLAPGTLEILPVCLFLSLTLVPFKIGIPFRQLPILAVPRILLKRQCRKTKRTWIPPTQGRRPWRGNWIRDFAHSRGLLCWDSRRTVGFSRQWQLSATSSDCSGRWEDTSWGDDWGWGCASRKVSPFLDQKTLTLLQIFKWGIGQKLKRVRGCCDSIWPHVSGLFEDELIHLKVWRTHNCAGNYDWVTFAKSFLGKMTLDRKWVDWDNFRPDRKLHKILKNILP